MLKELKLNNLAIIKEVNLEFSETFTTLTGETGAGKSMILDGISLLIGERGNILNIRNGENSLEVECVITLTDVQVRKLEELGYDISDNELIIHRSFDINSTSKVYINGKRAKVSTLKEIMTNILDLVGQHEHQYLLNSNYHLELFDKFLDEEGKKLKQELIEIVNKYKKNSLNLLNVEKNITDVIEKKELYLYQIEEFEKVNPKEDEDEILENEYKKIFNSKRLNELLNESVYLIDENILNNFNKLEDIVSELKEVDEKYIEYESILGDISNTLSELLNDLYKDLEKLDSDISIDDIVNRINDINKLKKKYGPSLKQVIINYEDVLQKVNGITVDYDILTKLKQTKKTLAEEYKECAIKLSKKRKEIALKMEENINKEFYDLNMKNASFKVSFEKNTTINTNGIDNIYFSIKTNVGDDFKPLSKVASGGEISRIMLALKIIFAKVDNISVLIFDEIDTGISGETVSIVAKKMRELSKNVQIICVTHSPQIAAYSKEQIYIEKVVVDNSTQTVVKKLEENQRIDKIARLISGDKITKNAIENAKDLIEQGKKYE